MREERAQLREEGREPEGSRVCVETRCLGHETPPSLERQVSNLIEASQVREAPLERIGEKRSDPCGGKRDHPPKRCSFPRRLEQEQHSDSCPGEEGQSHPPSKRLAQHGEEPR